MRYSKYAQAAALIMTSYLSASTVGILGGQDSFSNTQAYSGFVDPAGNINRINFGLSGGIIESVALNNSGFGLAGGRDFTPFPNIPAYAAIIAPSGQATSLNIGIDNGIIQSVALNSSGVGLIGGNNLAVGPPNPAFVAYVTPQGQLQPLNLGGLNGTIKSVALNDDGIGLIGGQNGNFLYAAFTTPQGSVTSLDLDSGFENAPQLGVTSGTIESVAINIRARGVIGGRNDDAAEAYAALVDRTGLVRIRSLGISGMINAVAINDDGLSLIGGTNSSSSYAAYIFSDGEVSPLSGLPSVGTITSVALNDSGQGLVGGSDELGQAYAAYVSRDRTIVRLEGLPSNGIINSVAINEFGQGLIGGQKNPLTGAAYAALVTASGQVIPLNLGILHGQILSVALLSQIPTENLSGNNLAFATYINENAPYDAFYFAPAYFDGTLSQALESAAPTRNAFALFTADNNMFYIDSLLSNHCRNTRHIRQLEAKKSSQVASALDIPSEELLAWSSRNVKAPPPVKKHPYEVWGTLLGALAYQKKQHQTPAFNPTTGGIILGFDGKTSRNGRVGTGAAYTYTYIHEKQNAGHSRINQEYLFLYTMWDNRRWYVDTALMAGFFQIDNVRKIHMTAFEFESKSHPKGWQLAPHFEFGYDFNSKSRKLTTEPFVMLDWVSNWQGHYKEHGSGPFNAGQKRHYSSFLRSETGVRVYETFLYDNWNFILEEKVSYVNKKPFKVGRVNAFLVGAPGSFTVETLTTTQNLGVAELEFIFQPHKKRYPTTTLTYQGEFGSMYQSHLMSLELSWNF